MPASGRKKPKLSGKSTKAQARVSPETRSSASTVSPSVARMKRALALTVAGLARNASSLAPNSPGSATARCMLLVCRTPPQSERLVAPARSRAMVVSLLPKASRKEKGNSIGSKGWPASSVTACSISMAFMDGASAFLIRGLEYHIRRQSASPQIGHDALPV